MRIINWLSAILFRDTVGAALFACYLLILPACGPASCPESLATIQSDVASSAPTAQSATVTPTIAEPTQLQPIASATPPSEIDIEDLRNSTYRGILDEGVMLVGGTYEGEPFVPGGASRTVITLLPESIAFGDLNGDGRADAGVILVSNLGGSGNFAYLAAMESREGVPDNMATLLLGDRVRVKSLLVEDGRLIASLLSHAADDPACCPSLEITRTFRLRNGQLVDETAE